MNEPARSVVPPALLAQLRARVAAKADDLPHQRWSCPRDYRSWDGEALREAVLDEAIAALVVGAKKKTGITDLLSLVPACPGEGSRCTRCEGKRWDKPLREQGLEIICGLCCGRGWMTSPVARSGEGARGAAV